jgi:molybdenum cofactor cytidylyltransferase
VIAGILLASGASTRFGGDKLVAPLGGRPVVRWSADAIVGAVDTLVVVVREDASAIRRALEGVPIRWTVNPDAERGMSTSIRAGIDALVDAHVVERLVARWREGGARAVQPRYDDGRGHPVLFDRVLFPALSALEGDVGARAVLDLAGDALALVTVAGPRPIDVDTPDALRGVEAELARRARA